jgi:hypothetical protein
MSPLSQSSNKQMGLQEMVPKAISRICYRNDDAKIHGDSYEFKCKGIGNAFPSSVHLLC